MERFVTYCDLAFLRAFYDAEPEGKATEFSEEDRLWQEVHDFLLEATHLYIDVPAEKLESLRSGMNREWAFLQDFLQRYTENAGLQTNFDPAPFSKIETADFHRERDTPHALFLVEDTEAEHDALSRRFGAFFLPFEALPAEWVRIGRHHTLNVSPDAEGEQRLACWDDLQQFAAPLTGLVICDQYIFSKGEQKAKNNLYPLLLSLLSDEAGHAPVDITLVTKDIHQDKPAAWLHEKVATHLRARTDADFDLCVVVPTGSRDYHDRHVFTNYGLFKSGQSFEEYFDAGGDVATDTTLDVQPLTDPNVLAVARQKLSEVSKVVENSGEKLESFKNGKPVKHKAWHGSKGNRLFGAAINESFEAPQ